LLTGDAIDGIPNLVKGMGPKTAEAELEKRMEFNNPITSAYLTFIYYLGEYEGIKRFARQYQLLKIIENLEQVPKGINFEVPEPTCYNCIEVILSEEIKDQLGWEFSQSDAP
jgi:5'-3' exonuclease